MNFEKIQQLIGEKTDPQENMNILIMGVDARSAEEKSRSDTIILTSINVEKKENAMVWIPRDTRIELNNHYDRINSVNYTKGPETACDVVGKLLDTTVDYYVIINFSGFAEIIDILGGVTIDVESDMYHPDPDPKLSINLSKGRQKLNGEDALRYVRFRGGPTADIGRTGRQQKFIKALTEELLKSNTLFKLPQLIPKIAENISTNIPARDMLNLAGLAKEFTTASIITQTLPGYSSTDPRTGASYWVADEDIAIGIIKDLFAGKTFDVAQDPPGWGDYQPIVPVQAEVQEEPDTSAEEDEHAGGQNESSIEDIVDPLPEGDEQQPEETGEIESGNEAEENEEPGEQERKNEELPEVPTGMEEDWEDLP